jgi:hypothetical protein
MTGASDEASKQAFAERIARQVLSMTPDEVDAFIAERGLSHLVDPERMAELLNAALSLSGDEGMDGPVERPPAPKASVGDIGFDLQERADRERAGTRLKH